MYTTLLKRAQIRTHTAKPGDEDIKAWLAGYYRLERDYDPFVTRLVEALINPDPGLEKKYTSFYSANDALTALALGKEPPTPETVKAAVGREPASTFGRILRDAVNAVV